MSERQCGWPDSSTTVLSKCTISLFRCNPPLKRSRRDVDRSIQAPDSGTIVFSECSLACSSFASRCGFGLFDCHQGTMFQGGLELELELVWCRQGTMFRGSRGISTGTGICLVSPGNNVPRVQGNLNPFECILRNRVPKDRGSCLSQRGLFFWSFRSR